MDTEDNKIWKYIQNNLFVAEHLFFYDPNDNNLDGIFLMI